MAGAVATALAGLLLAAATSVGLAASATVREGSSLVGQRLEVVGPWTGAEEKSFLAVIERFAHKTGADVTYTSAGDDLAPTVTARVAQGSPPDVALLPQPGLLDELVAKGALVPIERAAGANVDTNYASIWRRLGSVDGTLYGVWFKAADKSLWWYDARAFNRVGVTPPATVPGLLRAARRIAADGVTPVSVGGADGWTLTDQFENLYLTTAGPKKYDLLADHRIAWTDPSVTTTLRAMGELLQPQLVAGGLAGALGTDFKTSVRQVFATPPAAAMVMEGDFVAGVIASETNAQVGRRARVFPYPAATARSAKPLIVGGDAAVLMRDSKAGRALIDFLATPEAAAVWAERGGFISPNRNVEPRRYADPVTRSIARQVISARDGLRFDLSDLQPAAFGATAGSGLWRAFQDFLANPSDTAGAAAAMEAGAARVRTDTLSPPAPPPANAEPPRFEGSVRLAKLRRIAGQTFQHGVASGDPLEDRVVLWTRVTADAERPHDVAWTMARDEGLRDVVCSGMAVADPGADHTVHVDVQGLEPATTYYYAFETQGASSFVARTRTLPDRGIEHVRFAVASCASYNAGFFNAYARIAERDDIEFLLHLGDYIYETPNVLPPGAPQPPDIGRPFDPLHECVTLDDYRRRYAQYRTDPDVQALHRRHPVIATLDDHEFADGTWRDGSSWHRPEQGPFADRKAAGFQARWEWQPYRMPDPLDPTRVFRSVPLGNLAEIFLIDTRSRRDEPIAPPAMNDPGRTQLGTEQRDWLLHALDSSTAHWRLLGNASVMGHTWTEQLPESIRPALHALKLVGEDGSGPDPDQWDGYPVERATLLKHIREHDMQNVVVLSGDVHVAIVDELHAEPAAGDAPVAVEFVASSLTSMNIDDKMGWPRRDERSLALERTAVDTLPHWKWCEFDSNGYVVIDVNRERVQAEWWFVDTVLARSTLEELGARWLVEHGSQQAVEVS